MPFPFIPLAISGISALAGLLGNRKKTATQSSTNESRFNSTDSYSNTTTPQLLPEAQRALETLIPGLLNRVNQSADLRGYRDIGLRNIASSGDNARIRLGQMLAARGLNNSPAGAAILARQEDAQSKDTSDFYNSIPLLQRTMQGQDLDQLMKIASILPAGSTQIGTSNRTGTTTGTSTGTSTQPGNMLGGAVEGLGQGLAATFGYRWAWTNGFQKKETREGGNKKLKKR